MARRVAVVTARQRVSEVLAGQVNQVLGRWLEAVPLSMEQGLPAAGFDLILSATPALTSQLNQWFPGTPVLTVVRTLRRSAWEQVMALPPRTRALVVNDERDTAVETAALLSELGARHLDLHPYYPGIEVAPPWPVAITPGEPHLVPPWVSHVVDLGDRVVDPTTLLDALALLGAFDAAAHRVVAEYGATVLARPGVRQALQWLAALKGQLEAVLDAVQEGVVAYDAAGRVALVNRAAEAMLGREGWELVGRSVDQALACLRRATGSPAAGPGHPAPQGEVARLGGRHVVVRQVKSDPRLAEGGVITLRDVTEIRDLERRLRQDLAARGHVARYTFADIVGRSPAMQRTLDRARRFTAGPASVLILGETGTGKELFAQAIHNASPRRRFPFVAVNCAAVPEGLLESELFGYEEGSFTGARRGGKEGLFEQAHMGTIFLDEVADLPPHLQARLLRVLEERQVLRVGATRLRPIDVRVIAATNQDLEARVAAGQLRADLYYRLSALTLTVPPLRDRREDIPDLCQHFLRQLGDPRPLPPEVLAALMAYPWPGNVRELRNCIDYLVHVADGPFTLDHLPPHIARHAASPAPALDGRLLAVLRALAAGAGAGRRSLHRQLAGQGIQVSEHQVRVWIQTLAQMGLVAVRRGRAGLALTAAGQALVQGP